MLDNDIEAVNDELKKKDFSEIEISDIESQDQFFEFNEDSENSHADGAREKETKQKAEKEQVNESLNFSGLGADGWLMLFEYGVSSGCSAYSGEEASRYKMNASDKEKYREATEAYFSHANFSMPYWLPFAIMTTVLAGKMGYTARTDRQKRERANYERLKAERARKQSLKSDNVQSEQAETKEQKNEIETLKNIDYSDTQEYLDGRRYFDVDNDGYYVFLSDVRERIKLEDRQDKPTPLVLDLIEHVPKLGNIKTRKIILGQ
jgi:hypothetical protein